MGQVQPLPPRAERAPQDPPKAEAGEIVALPFVELDTVLKTMRMLRRFPDQSVLDEFNRADQD